MAVSYSIQEVNTNRKYRISGVPEEAGVAITGEWSSQQSTNRVGYSFRLEDTSPSLLDIRFNTSQDGRLSLLAPDGYVVQCEILIRLQEDEDGTYLVTSSTSTMYGHGETSDGAFEDFRKSLRDYFLSLVRDKDILGIPLKRELEELSQVFVEED